MKNHSGAPPALFLVEGPKKIPCESHFTFGPRFLHATGFAAWMRHLLLDCVVLAVIIGFRPTCSAELATNGPPRRDRSLIHTNDVGPEVPWSIHIAKLERSHPELKFVTTVGKGNVLAMATVSEQLKGLAPDVGPPVVAINGDFYDKSENYAGRPRDLEISQGELISSPAGHSCFWIDRQGNPQMTNVYSHFHVVWADGKVIPFGLNGERSDDAAVLYTSVVGPSTRTTGGVELILEPTTNSLWLPLRAGETCEARVREVRNTGNTSLQRTNRVLSIGPALIPHVPALKCGDTLKLVTETYPDLSGVDTAIGGGPALVHDGKVLEWKNFILMRHPRTALGWNKTHFFLVEVDGRQSDLSLGMTFPELAAYMLKL